MNTNKEEFDSVDVYELYQRRVVLYRWYKRDRISLREYLELIKPLDYSIDKVEMSTLRDMLVRKNHCSNFLN